MELLTGILSSKSRAVIFEILFRGDEKELYLRELERVAKLSTASIRFEMRNLIELDLIKTRRDGNRLYYKANLLHPLYRNIQELVNKTRGPHLKIKKALEKHKDVEMAFIFGSYAKKNMKSHSDIDLFVIGNIKSIDLSDITYDLQLDFGREINYHNYSKKEALKKIEEKNHFLISLRDEKKIFLKGNQNEFKNFF